MGEQESNRIMAIINERDRLRAALTQIANVEGEDDPKIMWPWAREVAAQALVAEKKTGEK